MSLINDALKRAKQAQQKGSVPLMATGTSSVPRAGEPVRHTTPGAGIVLPIALVVLVAAVGLIIWLVMIGLSPRYSPTIAKARPAPVNLPSARVSLDSKSARAATVSPAAATATPIAPIAQTESPPANPTVSPSSVATADTAVVASNTVASGPPPPPPLPKLQGVFYRPQRPAALVDGKMVLIGSKVGEHHVLAITERTVTIARAGQTNILELPE